MKKDHPAGQPAWGTNSPKTQEASRRPSLATTKSETITAIKPTTVQTIAKVYVNH